MHQSVKLQPSEFLGQARTLPVIDVRSPEEFLQGHIPGAFNIPLFDNEERAMVGTTYTHQGNRSAILKGLELVGPKLKYLVSEAEKAGHGRELLLHCWRGGMRSEAMAWLFNFSGITTYLLEGGYKAYRRYIRESLATGPKLIVLSGMTGSGKTEILGMMAEEGARVIDLEKLARHKGSAFGALGQEPQPTTEQFENDLAGQWLSKDPKEPVWVEDESMNIGKVIIPGPFYRQMFNAPLVYLEVPFETRVGRLMREYGEFNKDELESLLSKISHRMGGDKAKKAISSLENNDLKGAVSEALAYYDKTYQYSFQKKKGQMIRLVRIHQEAEFKSVALLLRTIQ